MKNQDEEDILLNSEHPNYKKSCIKYFQNPKNAANNNKYLYNAGEHLSLKCLVFDQKEN